MAKYCKNYRVICTCPTCENVQCAFSSRTRAEAEATRGVKLDVQGREIQKAAPDPGTGGSRSVKVPTSVLTEALRPRGPNRDGVLVALVAVFAALFLGTLAVLYIVVKMQSRPVSESIAAPVQQPPAPANAIARPPAPTTAAPAAKQPEPSELMAEPLAQPEPQPDLSAELMAQANVPPPRPTPYPQMDLETKKEVTMLQSAGNTLVARKDYPLARKFYQSTIDRNPGYFQGYNNLANTYSDEGRLEQAAPIYRKGLEISPKSAFLHFNLGLSLYRAKRYTESLQEFQWAIQIDSNDSEAHLMAGICLYRLSDFEQSAAYFHRAVKLDNASAEAFYNLSVVYRKMGRANIADSYLAEAKTLNPNIVRTVEVTGGG